LLVHLNALSKTVRFLCAADVFLRPQGRFKQPGVPFDSLVLGSDFTSPLKLPAGPLLGHAITWLAHKLGGGVSVDVAGQQPHIRAPLIAAAQVVHVAQPGQQCDLLAPVEDMRLVEPGLVNRWTGVPSMQTVCATDVIPAAEAHAHGSCTYKINILFLLHAVHSLLHAVHMHSMVASSST
jgi:hypothetical protein